MTNRGEDTTSPTTSIKEDASFEMYAFDDLSSHFSCDDKTSSTCEDSMNARSRGSNGSNGSESAAADERTVKGARCMFLFVLLLIASALCGVVYLITKNEEEDDFNSQFQNYGTEVIRASNDNVKKAFQALETLSVTMTGLIKDQANNGYPAGFIKIPDTEHHLVKTKENADAYVVGYMPHVNRADYDLWNEFALKNQDWIVEANAAHGIDHPKFHTYNNSTDPLFFPQLHDYKYYDAAGNEVIMPFEVATCSQREQEKQLLNEIEATIVETKHVATEPSTYKEPFYVPVWQLTPAPHPDWGLGLGNFNLVGDPIFSQILEIINKTHATTFFDICDGSKWFEPSNFPEDGVFSLVISPVFDSFDTENAATVGTLSAVVTWRVFFEDILVRGSEPVHVVMKNKCGNKKFTYLIEGDKATFLGDDNDAHDPRYDNMNISASFADFAYSDDYLMADDESCTYTINVYPTREFEEAYSSNKPWYYGLVVLSCFFLASLAFFAFDTLVMRRQKSLASIASKQSALVASLFPQNIHKKLLAEAEEAEIQKRNTIGKAGLRSYLLNNSASTDLGGLGGDHLEQDRPTQPIADLFAATTVMFADICGFTAWSSTREPSQVFTLLETIYHAFDNIAKRRKVFKVETIGDCYVAVCGLPDPRSDHGLVMSRFAHDCMRTMHLMTMKLERELGPDTADLGLRIGLHSGPVVAGVLRGDKSRFQLFGDTMNTASRMESTSYSNKIQISEATANLLSEAGKSHWYTERENRVTAKGKGEMQTYWLTVGGDNLVKALANREDSSCSTLDPVNPRIEKQSLKSNNHSFGGTSEKKQHNARIAEWTVEVLSTILKSVLASRKARGVPSDAVSKMENLERSLTGEPLDEVKEVIMLPEYNKKKYHVQDASEIKLGDQVMHELKEFVQIISSMYNDNAFHNWSHANHVTMSVVKLLSRINAPDITGKCNDKTLHDHTYGITSDPLTRFAVVFSALIHDLDHVGVPNSQLVKENSPVAALYSNKSVAEQNSVDIAWDLLMEPCFATLRRHIYTNEAEFKRFRQLVVNTVLATDIMDKDLKQLRNKRWDNAFDVNTGTFAEVGDSRKNRHDELAHVATNRKATIVIEHLIQASDVSHTMQHWHIYRKWNQMFFEECYQAFMEGRAEQDPSTTWYKGEIGFFDYYIIPLAKKLKECGVFGVSSDEYLNYALENRREWEARGESLVQEMVTQARKKVVRNSILEASNHSSHHPSKKTHHQVGSGSLEASSSHHSRRRRSMNALSLSNHSLRQRALENVNEIE